MIPNFVDALVEEDLGWDFSERITELRLHGIEVKLPMHVLILDLPLYNALVLERSCQDLAILKDLNVLNHARMPKEAPRRRHLFLPHQVKLEVYYFEFLDRQRLVSEQVQATFLAAADGVVECHKPRNV